MKGILTIVSGFSGAGKGSMMKKLVSQYDNYALSVSSTTRKPREGEKDGIDYFFLSKEEFEQKIADKAFLEYASYVGNYYGTSKEYVLSQLQADRDVILEIEIQGALEVKKMLPDTLLVYVCPPSADILYERLVGRGTETEQVIQSRLQRAVEESKGLENYDYIIINDDLDKAVSDLHKLIEAQHLKVGHNQDFLKKLIYEMNEKFNP